MAQAEGTDRRRSVSGTGHRAQWHRAQGTGLRAQGSGLRANNI